MDRAKQRQTHADASGPSDGAHRCTPKGVRYPGVMASQPSVLADIPNRFATEKEAT